MRLCFCPCAMSTVRTCVACVRARARFNGGRLALFDTSVVNQKQSCGRVALSAIIRSMKPTSPPAHQSSPEGRSTR